MIMSFHVFFALKATFMFLSNRAEFTQIFAMIGSVSKWNIFHLEIGVDNVLRITWNVKLKIRRFTAASGHESRLDFRTIRGLNILSVQ